MYINSIAFPSTFEFSKLRMTVKAKQTNKQTNPHQHCVRCFQVYVEKIFNNHITDVGG